MRIIKSSEVTEIVRMLFLRAARMPGKDALRAVKEAYEIEPTPIAKEALHQLVKNAEISDETGMPYCQDTGMAVVFVEIGQQVFIEGGLTEAINKGVHQAYREGFFRKSVLDPITRQNTQDNTPAVIHYDIVPGELLKIYAAPKGFGSENMSRLIMLNPSDGIDGIKQFVLDSVIKAGGSPCPPVILGIGIGGTFEKCALIAKKELLREIGIRSEDAELAALEMELKDSINALGIGALGFGGPNYCLDVHIAKYPTHIAGLPVAVNFQCHASRHAYAVI